MRGSPAGTAGLNPITLDPFPSLNFCLGLSLYLSLPPVFFYRAIFIMADLQGRKVFKVFNQDFIVNEQYNVTKELGQGAYGIVWYVSILGYFRDTCADNGEVRPPTSRPARVSPLRR